MARGNNMSAIISSLNTPAGAPTARPITESLATRVQKGRKVKAMMEGQGVEPPLTTNEKVAPVVQNEVTVGADMPTKIYQCSVCKNFFTDGQGDLGTCPTCGTKGSISVVGDVVPAGNPELAQVNADAQADMNEALNLLTRGQTKKFVESYGNRTKLTARGGLELSYTKGRFSTVVESMMNLRQKAAYDMAVKLQESTSKMKMTPTKLQEHQAARVHDFKVSHVGLRAKNEMFSLAYDATKILERMGVKYDYKKFTEQLHAKATIRTRRLAEDVETYMSISGDDATYCNPAECGEGQYSEAARRVISENGLEVLSAETTFDGDAAQVKIRVKDNEDSVVDMEDVAQVLASEYEAPVVVLAQEVPGDPSMLDVTLVVNEDAATGSPEPAADPDEPAEPEAVTESIAKHNKRIAGQIMTESKNEKCPNCGKPHDKCTCNGGPISECGSKNESVVVEDPATVKYFILSLESPEEDPSVLAYDGALVSLSDVNAEDTAAIFPDVESAQKFIEDNGLVGTAKVVTGTIVDDEGEVVTAVPATDEGVLDEALDKSAVMTTYNALKKLNSISDEDPEKAERKVVDDVMKKLGITEEQAYDLLDAYDSDAPSMKSAQDRVRKVLGESFSTFVPKTTGGRQLRSRKNPDK